MKLKVSRCRYATLDLKGLSSDVIIEVNNYRNMELCVSKYAWIASSSSFERLYDPIWALDPLNAYMAATWYGKTIEYVSGKTIHLVLFGLLHHQNTFNADHACCGVH